MGKQVDTAVFWRGLAGIKTYLVLLTLVAFVLVSLNIPAAASADVAGSLTGNDSAETSERVNAEEASSPEPTASMPAVEPTESEKPSTIVDDKPSSAKETGQPQDVAETFPDEGAQQEDLPDQSSDDGSLDQLPAPIEDVADGPSIVFDSDGALTDLRTSGIQPMSASTFSCATGDVFATTMNGQIVKFEYNSSTAESYYNGWSSLISGLQRQTMNRVDSVNGIAVASANTSASSQGQVFAYIRSYDAAGNWYVTPVKLAANGGTPQYVGSGGGTSPQFIRIANNVIPIAGTVDPVSGEYLYGGYYKYGNSLVFGLYSLNPATGTSRQLAIVDTGSQDVTSSVTSANGDIAFDASGNLYLLRHVMNSSTAVISTVTASQMASLRSDPVTTWITQPGTRLNVPLGERPTTVNGIALNPNGTVAISSTNWVKNLDPIKGQFTSTVDTGIKNITDLASCQIPGPNTLTVEKVVSGGKHAGSDQFVLRVKNGSSVLGSVTTNGPDNGKQTQMLGPILITAGSTVTIEELAAGTTNLARYNSAVVCKDKQGSTLTDVSGTSGVLQVPSNATGKEYTCTITNTKKTPAKNTLEVKKNIVARSVAGDNFEVSINGLSPAASTGASEVTATTGAREVEAGTTYTISERALAGSLSDYTTTLKCTGTDPNGRTATLSGTSLAGTNVRTGNIMIPSTAEGLNVVCEFANDSKTTPVVEPSNLTLKKAMDGSRAAANDQFYISISDGGLVSGRTTTGSGNVITSEPVTWPVIPGNTYRIDEIMGAGATSTLDKYSTTLACVGTDKNGKTVTLMRGTANQTGNVSIPVGADGLDVTCTFTNKAKPADPSGEKRLKIIKVINGRAKPDDAFKFNIDTYDKNYNSVRREYGQWYVDSANASTQFDTGWIDYTNLSIVDIEEVYQVRGSTASNTADIRTNYKTMLVCDNGAAGTNNSTGQSGNYTAGQRYWRFGGGSTSTQGNNNPANWTGDVTCVITNTATSFPATNGQVKVGKDLVGLAKDNDAFAVGVVGTTGYVSSTAGGNGTYATPYGGGVARKAIPTFMGQAVVYQPGSLVTVVERFWHYGGSGEASPDDYDTELVCTNADSTIVTTTAVEIHDGADGFKYKQAAFVMPAGGNITCKWTNTAKDGEPDTYKLRVKKNVPQRVKNSDQFELSVKESGKTEVLGSAVTKGFGKGIQDEFVEINVERGKTYEWSEKAGNATTNIANYIPSGTCVIAGTGTVVANNAATGKLSNTVTIPQDLEAGKTVECTFTNAIQEADFSLLKVDDNGDPLAGAEFQIWYDIDGNGSGVISAAETCGPSSPDAWNATATTDSNGAVVGWAVDAACATTSLHPYPGNKYVVKETKAPLGYRIDGEGVYPFTMEADKTTELRIENKILNGSVSWDKVDKDGSGDLLGGSEWLLTKPNGDVVTVADCSAPTACGEGDYTDLDDIAGRFKLSLSGFEPGEYTLVESKAPSGFLLDKTAYKITFDAADENRDYKFGTNGIIANERIEVPFLPLTGGASRDVFMIASGGILGLALLGSVVGLRRRNRNLATS